MTLVPKDDEFDKLYWIGFDEFENFDFAHRKKAYLRALELCGLVK